MTNMLRSRYTGITVLTHIVSLCFSVPSGSGGCEEGYLECKQGGCVEERAVCDGTVQRE